MRALRAMAAVTVLLAASRPGQAQNPLERATRAFERGDESSAHAALLEIFAADDANRVQAIQASAEALRNAGGTDVWLAAASRRAKVHPDDAARSSSSAPRGRT